MLFLPCLAFAQRTPAQLAQIIDLEVRKKQYSPTRMAAVLDSINVSKASIGASTTFPSNVTFVLSGGKSFGKYTNGQTASWAGLTVVQAIQDAAVEYINPAFSFFSLVQNSTVEVCTTLSGSRTFNWGINLNSGVVPTIDLYDVTAASTLLAGTANDGTQSQNINTTQLNTNGASQTWRGVGNNTSPPGTFNSANFTVTARFYRFWGATSSSPANSASVRALASNAFHAGATTFTLTTGTTLTKFVVALPPSVTIASVIDTGNLNADITSSFILTGTVNVLDAGSTNRAYNIYEYNIGAPYPTSTNLSITTTN